MARGMGKAIDACPVKQEIYRVAMGKFVVIG
jgi:uncharacterized protein YaiI (UPF0178 family)